ncbi:MAG: hypothetical protein ABIQ11_05535 [Saprospiraceae bacterium]
MASFTSFLNRISNWKTLVGLILLFLIFPMVLFRNAMEKINALAGKEIGPIDLTFGFSPKRTLQMIEDYGDAGRAYYQHVEMSIDIIFPIVYAFLFAVLITIIYRRLINGPVRHLNMLPVVVMFFDFLENFAIISLLKHYPEQSMLMASLCELFKLLKWLMFGLIIFLVIYGLIKLLLKKQD